MQTVSLKLAQQLKEAGYPQDYGDFYHVQSPDDVKTNRSILYYRQNIKASGSSVSFLSPTADEMISSLPNVIKFSPTKPTLCIYIEKYIVDAWKDEGEKYEVSYKDPNKPLYDAAKNSTIKERIREEIGTREGIMTREGISNWENHIEKEVNEHYHEYYLSIAPLFFWDKSLADAAAKMWLYLNKQGLL